MTVSDDLAVGYIGGEVEVLLQEDSGELVHHTTVSAGSNIAALHIAELTCSAPQELIIIPTYGRSLLRWSVGEEEPRTERLDLYLPEVGPLGSVVQDFGGDGFADYIVTARDGVMVVKQRECPRCWLPSLRR